MSNKRGLSDVVATVTLILLSVVAVAVIVSFILPFFDDSLDSTTCTKYRDYFVFVEEDYTYNCFVETINNNQYAVSIGAASANEEMQNMVEGMKLTFVSSTGESETAEIKNGFPTGSAEGEIRKINVSLATLDLPKSGEIKTYVYTSAKKFEDVWVIPLIKNKEGTERICEKSDSIRISENICNKVILVT